MHQIIARLGLPNFKEIIEIIPTEKASGRIIPEVPITLEVIDGEENEGPALSEGATVTFEDVEITKD